MNTVGDIQRRPPTGSDPVGGRRLFVKPKLFQRLSALIA